jgi:hypothetical protein
MPEEEKHRSLRPWWLLVWQRRWWVALATLFLLIWWLVPPLLYRYTGTAKDAKLKAITDTRTALFAGLIGVGALLTFWLNSRVYRITDRTLQITEQGHITERYTKAIEQLGDDGLTIRLGGIYALERIAKDSERDHPTVVEVLSAFVREASDPVMRFRASQPDDAKPLPAKAEQAAALEFVAGERLPTDIQAALTVLGRLPQLAGVSRGDLTDAHLQGANLLAANLHGARLWGANLRLADLRGANLQDANLEVADLQRARLRKANLEGARLEGADLRGTISLSVRLREANLEAGDLRKANLWGRTCGGQI